MRPPSCVAVALAILAAGCGVGAEPGAPALPAAEQAVLDFGHAPSPDATVVWQPDVTVVAGGAEVIRSVTSDGLTFAIDGRAAGATELAEDRIMVITSGAVGRVVDIRDEGDTRLVTVAPVTFTDVVRDATVTIDHRLDSSTLAAHHVPDLPAAVLIEEEDLSTDAAPSPPFDVTSQPVVLPEIVLVAAPAGSDQMPPARRSGSSTVTIGDWTVKPYAEPTRLGVEIGQGSTGGLKGKANIALLASDVHLRSNLSVREGVLGDAEVLVEGITGLEVHLEFASPNGSADNDKVTAEIPLKLKVPIPPSPATAGLPMTLEVSFKYTVTVAMGARNTTMTGLGRYSLDGPIGVRGGAVVTPTMVVEQPLMDSLGGVSLAAAGLVYAAKMQLTAGFGTPAFTAGPTVSLTGSVGVTQGSAIGITECRIGTLKVDVGAGVGISVNDRVVNGVLAMFPTAKKKVTPELTVSHTVFNRTEHRPDVPACK